MKRLFILALLIVFCHALPVSAGTLLGRVIEIQVDKTIIVENTGRRVKVVLQAADLPEKDQPYGDVARQHLSGFILGRQVSIEYSGLGAGALLIGRVFYDGRDIGLQMIRDGVAWFDKKYENDLTESERRVYADSEQAARNEHRGIWQDPSPVSPWQWRQAKADSSKCPGADASSAKKSTVTTEASAAGAPQDKAKPSYSSVPARKAEAQKWPLFSPSGNPFSIRMPGAGRQYSAEVVVPHGEPINANFYGVQHLKIGYVAVWASGPAQDEAVSKLFDQALEALNRFSQANGLPCEFVQEKDATMNGYVGRRYNVRGCFFNGALRYYYKVEGKTLKIRLVGVMSQAPGDPLINQFLESFTINN